MFSPEVHQGASLNDTHRELGSHNENQESSLIVQPVVQPRSCYAWQDYEGVYSTSGHYGSANAETSYYRARHYDPTAGRFLSEDPVRFSAGSSDFFACVSNNPVNANDPPGLAADPIGSLFGRKLNLAVKIPGEVRAKYKFSLRFCHHARTRAPVDQRASR